MLITVVFGGGNAPMIVTYVAFRGAFGPHDGIVLEETEDNVLLAVENRDESNFRPLPFEIQFSAWTEQNKNRHKHYRRRSMSLPKMETGHTCPPVRGWSLGEPVHHPEPGKRTYCLCARRTTGFSSWSHRADQAGSQSSAYLLMSNAV
jgi:hypothetical protein